MKQLGGLVGICALIVSRTLQGKYMGLNMDGLFRFFYTDEDGNEFTKGFNPSGRFVISYSAILEKRPSFFSIEALQDSRVLQFDYEKFYDMMQKDLRRYPFVYKLLESIYIMKELREKSLLLDDATKRYQEFQSLFKDVENQILLRHVASYLGITPETLSRIRSKMN